MSVSGSHYLLETTGGRIAMELPPPAGRDSVYAFSMHKSGSSLLTNMLQGYCADIGMPVVNLEDFLFNKGVPPDDVTAPIDNLLNLKGYAFIGSRALWKFTCNAFPETARKVVLLRDPRDVVISAYFSFLGSHTLPHEGAQRMKMLRTRDKLKDLSPDDYANRPKALQFFKRSYATLLGILEMENTRGYRYEDVVYHKHTWLKDMVLFLGLDLRMESVDRIAGENDIRPAGERPDQHIRQVSPGNHRVHLSPGTIAVLDEFFAEEIRLLGYDTVPTIPRTNAGTARPHGPAGRR